MKQELNTQEKIQDALIKEVEFVLIDAPGLNENSILDKDFGADSLDTVEMLMGCEKEFEIVISDKDFEILPKKLQSEPLWETIKYFCEINGIPYIKPVVKDPYLNVQTNAKSLEQKKSVKAKEAVAKVQSVRAATTNSVKQKKR